MKKYLIILITAITMISFSSCCERIDAGYEGIRVNLYGSNKGVDDVELCTGMQFYNPFTTSVYEYPVFFKPVDYEAFSVPTKEGASIYFNPEFQVSVKPGKASNVFRKYRKDFGDVIEGPIRIATMESFRTVVNKYTLDQVVSNREKVENEIRKRLSSIYAKEGFLMENLTTGMKYPDAIEKAVIAKTTAVQKAQQAANELAVAEAEARKKIVRAEAEAKANQLKQASLTPLLIQQEFIRKWRGNVPQYMGSSNIMTILPSGK